jgi:hypothetical protein
VLKIGSIDVGIKKQIESVWHSFQKQFVTLPCPSTVSAPDSH